MDYETILRDFVKAMKSAQSEHDYYYAKVNELDKATDDILHQFELGTPKDRGRFSTKLALIRKQRRFAKDRVAMTKPINVFATAHNADIKAIERLLGDVRKERKNMQVRTYKPKVLKDLAFEGVKE